MTKKTDHPTPKPPTEKIELTQEEDVPKWEPLLKLIRETDIPDDFLSPEDREQGEQDRDPFADLKDEDILNHSFFIEKDHP